jgi:superfamily II DNA helicase RecQ
MASANSKFTEKDIENVYSCFLTFPQPLKVEQREVLTHVINGDNVFAVLHTGYGKTICFAALPAILKEVTVF